jgi:hypothetical protein
MVSLPAAYQIPLYAMRGVFTSKKSPRVYEQPVMKQKLQVIRGILSSILQKTVL